MPSLAKFVKLSIYLEVNIKKYNLIVNLHDFKLYFFYLRNATGFSTFLSHIKSLTPCMDKLIMIDWLRGYIS